MPIGLLISAQTREQHPSYVHTHAKNPCASDWPRRSCLGFLFVRHLRMKLWLLLRWRGHDIPAWICSTWFWNVIGQDWLLWSGALMSRYLNIVIRRSAYSIAFVRLFKPCRRGAWLWIDKNSLSESPEVSVHSIQG